MLLEEGWTCVRHSREEKWPIILEEAVESFDSPSATLSPSASLSSLPTLPSQGTSDEPPSPGSPIRTMPIFMNLSHSLGQTGSSSFRHAVHTSRVLPRRISLQMKGQQQHVLRKMPSYTVRSLRPLSIAGEVTGDAGSALTVHVTLYAHTCVHTRVSNRRGVLGIHLPALVSPSQNQPTFTSILHVHSATHKLNLI